MSKSFSGLITALLTPFRRGEVDFESLQKLVVFQEEQGIDGFVVNGTTAESPTLSSSEMEEILKAVKDAKGSRTPIILGVGTNSTTSTLENVRRASELGVDGLLVVVPYYNKPPQRGIYEHFAKVADNTDLPIILYNVPGRTVVGMEPETVKALSQIKNIVGIKEATGDMSYFELLKKQDLPEDFVILSGDDDTCIEMALKGADGVISVISHVIPQDLGQILLQARNGNENARENFKVFSELLDWVYSESNPMGVKAAMNFMNVIHSPELRLPLVELSESNKTGLKSELKKLGLI